MKNVFVGYTRFSLVDPGSKAWVVSQRDDYLERLFEDERLKDRIDILFKKSLPVLSDASKNVIFFHFLLYAEELPVRYKDDILEKSEKFDFLIPVEVLSGDRVDISFLIEEKLKSLNISDAIVGRFSLDDDDILSSKYFFSCLEYMKEPFVGKVISFGKGLTGLYEKGRFTSIREVYHPKVNIGMLFVCRLRDGFLSSPRSGNHMYVDKKSPLILDSREYMFFWTAHSGQDTRVGRSGAAISDIEEYSVVEGELIRRDFFTVCDSLYKRNNLIDFNASSSGLRVGEFCKVGAKGRVVFCFSFYCPPCFKDKSILVLFEFSDKDEKALRAGLSKDVGVTLSPNEKIGFYRYLHAGPGKNYVEVSLVIPDSFDDFSFKVFDRGEIKTDFESVKVDCFI